MHTIDILKSIQPYSSLLDELFQQEQLYLQEKENFVKLKKDISIEYDFISLQLTGMYKVSEKAEEIQERLYSKVCFDSRNRKDVVAEIYCEDASRKEKLEMIIHKSRLLDTQFLYSEEIGKYLKIADSIAKRACNCTLGDNYRPGYYSKIFVSDEKIVLSQVNYMNSKSLNHKKDYSMRKLEFVIPLLGQKEKIFYNDYQIGEMLIRFSDNSSENNRSCGIAIKEQIEHECFLYGK